MGKQEFIDAVYAAGWRDRADAQHEGISRLWEKIYLRIEKAEEDLNEINDRFQIMEIDRLALKEELTVALKWAGLEKP